MLKSRYLIILLLIAIPYYSIAQIDLTQSAKPIYQGNESTALSVFDTNPESNNGKTICYTRYPKIVNAGHEGPCVQAEVVLMDRKSKKTTIIDTVWATNHNAANAVWINNDLIAYQVDHFRNFSIYSIKQKKKIYTKIDGELGHKSFNNKLYYTISNWRLKYLYQRTKVKHTKYSANQEGIWCLDLNTGKKNKVVSLTKIADTFNQQNPEITSNEATILHVEPNPINTKISFDYRHVKNDGERAKQLQGFVNANGTDIRWVATRPMHVIWYDNDNWMGIDMSSNLKHNYKFDTKGNKLELLSGSGCHMGSSPDRKWFISEFGYYWAEKDGYTRVYLYKKGNPKPYAKLAEWNNSKVTWKWVAHVNPSFSADGKRAYFIRARDDQDKFEAVMLDMTKL